MKTTPDVIAARIRAGYRPPEENPLRCDNCGAIRTRYPAEHHYCRRHGFYVHADGYCPAFSTEPFKAPRRAPRPVQPGGVQAMNPPCNQFSCPEYNQGQCFGGGCRTNPMPEPSEPDTEDGDDDSNN